MFQMDMDWLIGPSELKEDQIPDHDHSATGQGMKYANKKVVEDI